MSFKLKEGDTRMSLCFYCKESMYCEECKGDG